MSKQFRNFFFSGGTGVSFRLFRTGNIPNETNYRHLMDSVLFFNEVNDTAKEGEAGHVKKETDIRAMNRSLSHVDNFSRCVLAHQLPSLFAEQQAYQTAGTPLIGRGISITPLDSLISSTHRLDFLVENTLSFISTDSSIDISETIPGIVDLQVGSGIELYMVKATAADPTPGYLDAKVGNSMEISTNQLEVKYNNTNSINFGITASGLEANLQIQNTNTIEHVIGALGLSSDLRYDVAYFDVNASGLVLRPLSIDYSLIANNTITIGKLNSNIFGDGLTVGGTVDVDPKNSIELDGVTPNKQLQLVNDLFAPGNNKYYGTDALGVKGWHNTSSISYWELDVLGSNTGLFPAGSGCDSRGNFAISIGIDNIAGLDYSFAKGKNSISWIKGQKVSATKMFEDFGDAQCFDDVILTGKTSDGSTIELSIENDGSTYFVIPSRTALFTNIEVIGYDIDSFQVIDLKENCSYVNIANVATAIGSATTIHTQKTFLGTAAISIGVESNRIKIECTGEEDTNIRWVAKISGTMVASNPDI